VKSFLGGEREADRLELVFFNGDWTQGRTSTA
jgi:hypothetical protein